jgi:hypothetical protein
MNTLKEALYQTIHRSNKPLKQIADELGISANYLARAALPDQEESETGTGCNFPLKKLIPLTKASGDFSVLDYLEWAVGRVAFTLPREECDLADLSRLSMKSVKEFGDLMGELDSDLGNGKIDPEEIPRLRKEGQEAIQAIVNLLYCAEHHKGR